jgi:hypothetical protein
MIVRVFTILGTILMQRKLYNVKVDGLYSLHVLFSSLRFSSLKGSLCQVFWQFTPIFWTDRQMLC